jgi:hypothetical protein
MEAFPSIWGHWAGGPGNNPEDVAWLDGKLRAFFEEVRESLGLEKLKL